MREAGDAALEPRERESDGLPPVAERVATERRLHGQVLLDEYAWMRDTSDPRLLAYLAAERAYYEAEIARLRPLARRLQDELTARLPADPEYSVAWEVGGFLYRTCMLPTSENPQLLRAPKDGREERVLLDGDVVARETGYADIAVREPSPDGTLLAWSVDRTGVEVYELRIRDLDRGADLPEVIAGTYPGVAWSADSSHLFYLVPDEQNRPYKVLRHRLGTDVSDDQLVYEEGDRRFELTLSASRSGELAIITAASRDTTEVRLVPLGDPTAAPTLIEPRRRGMEYRVDHARSRGASVPLPTPNGPRRDSTGAELAGELMIVTDAFEPEFSLAAAALPDVRRRRWSQVANDATAPARNDTRLLRCDVLASHLVLTLRRDGERMLAIAEHGGGQVREVPPSLAAGTIAVEHAEEYERDTVIISEQSLIEPPLYERLDLRSGTRTRLLRLEVPGYDPAAYRTERRIAPANDGAAIPVTLAYRHDTPLDGSAPCVLYGYGAYEEPSDPEFSRSLPSLLNRGVVYAIGHIRGGGERGRSWWRDGMLRAKQNSFADFIAVADWLAGKGGEPIVDGSRIVARGGSAGGLLQGAVFSMRPDRWRALVAEVPFVDCVNTMLDDSLPLTVIEWDEWGDPRDPDDFAYMRAYSPYDNPPLGERPALLVTGALNDVRVSIHEPAKWVARLRATDRTRAQLLFRAELGMASHGGPSGRGAQFAYEAEILAFVLDALGVAE